MCYSFCESLRLLGSTCVKGSWISSFHSEVCTELRVHCHALLHDCQFLCGCVAHRDFAPQCSSYACTTQAEFIKSTTGMATHHCCLQLSVSLSRHYSHHNLWSLDLTDRSYEVWLRLVNYLHSFLTHWTWLEMQQKTNTISVQQCVSGQWGRPDLYQLCLCVPECSSFIWRQGGSQAAWPHSYSSNLPRTKKKKKRKKSTEELLSATLLTSSGGKCLYMINKTWCQSLSVLGIFHSYRSNTSRAWWGTKTRCRGELNNWSDTEITPPNSDPV